MFLWYFTHTWGYKCYNKTNRILGLSVPVSEMVRSRCVRAEWQRTAIRTLTAAEEGEPTETIALNGKIHSTWQLDVVVFLFLFFAWEHCNLLSFIVKCYFDLVMRMFSLMVLQGYVWCLFDMVLCILTVLYVS